MIGSFDAFPASTPSTTVAPTIVANNPSVTTDARVADSRIADLERQLAEARRREEELKRKEEEDRRRIEEERKRAAWEEQIREDERTKAKRQQDDLRKQQEQLLAQIVAARRSDHTSSISESQAYGLPYGKRVAFVVGINAYSKLGADSQLRTAVNDAVEVGKVFRAMGFTVIEGLDVNRSQFYEQWFKFLAEVPAGGTAVFFFAGHGMQLTGVNYLLPGDVTGPATAQEPMLKKEAISFNELREDLQDKKPAMNLFILDACRNNPYKSSSTRNLASTRGLARVEVGGGSFVMYSADAGQEALDRLPDDDESQKNSVYTRRLIPLLTVSDMPLQTVAQRVRSDVQSLTARVHHAQTPAYYDGLVGLVCLSTMCSRPTQAAGRKG
jgi:hypothetical protein